MIEHFVEQGSPEWLALRLGIPTASEFHKIITPAKGELSKQSKKYAHYLVAESLLNQPLETLDHLEWIARGKELEPAAVSQYEFTHEVETRAVGFVTTDDGRMGASPDRLIVGQRAGLEVKCPSPQIHIGYAVDGPGDDYRVQVQGQLYIAELEYVDLYAFFPTLPPVHIRTYRDEPFIAKLALALNQFCDELEAMKHLVRSKGFVFPARRPLTVADQIVEDHP